MLLGRQQETELEMILLPPGVEAVVCAMHLGLWSLGWAAGKRGWSGLCQTSSPIVWSPAMAVRECVEKWWVLSFSLRQTAGNCSQIL